jgi:hypothetical protein
MRKRRRRVLIIVRIAVVLAVIGGFAFVIGLYSGIEGEAWRIRAQGLPASVDELVDWYPSAVSAKNTDWIGLLQMAVNLDIANDDLQDGRFTEAEESPRVSFSPAEARSTFVNLPEIRRQSFIREFESFAGFAACELELYTEKGPVDERQSCLCKLLWFARHVRSYPDCHADQVVCEALRFAVHHAPLHLGPGKLTDTQLKTIDEVLQKLPESESTYRKLVAWRCFYLDSLRTQSDGFLRDAARFRKAQRVLDCVDELIAVSKLPMSERLPRADRIITTAVANSKAPDPVVSVLAKFGEVIDPYADPRETLDYDIGGHVFYREIVIEARIELLRTAVAIERYRLANDGELPASLDRIVPAYLPALSLTHAAKGAMTYETHGDAYKLKVPIDFFSWQTKAPYPRTFSLPGCGTGLDDGPGWDNSARDAVVLCIPADSWERDEEESRIAFHIDRIYLRPL